MVPAAEASGIAVAGGQSASAMKQTLLSSTALVSQSNQDILTPFSYTGGIVQFVVPTTGQYSITAFGGQGGSGDGNGGGDGGEAQAVFTLTAGETLEIAVGGAGGNGSSPKGAGGGGGGSFVILNDNGTKSVLVVGGGGGGGSGVNAYGGAGQAGGTATDGNGLGGGGNHALYGGGGGAGYKGNGNTAGFGNPSSTDGIGGKDYANGLSGGAGAAGANSPGRRRRGRIWRRRRRWGWRRIWKPDVLRLRRWRWRLYGGLRRRRTTPHVRAWRHVVPRSRRGSNQLHSRRANRKWLCIDQRVALLRGRHPNSDGPGVRRCRTPARRNARPHDPGPNAQKFSGSGTARSIAQAHPEPARVDPVRVRADAFGSGVPARDVRLSPDHAVFADGVLIPVRCLINGETIWQETARSVTYFHVELTEHDMIFAEGLPVESFLDSGNRASFANGGNVARLVPDFGPTTIAWRWEAGACAPLIIAGQKLDTVRARLRVIADQCLASPRGEQAAA